MKAFGLLQSRLNAHTALQSIYNFLLRFNYNQLYLLKNIFICIASKDREMRYVEFVPKMKTEDGDQGECVFGQACSPLFVRAMDGV